MKAILIQKISEKPVAHGNTYIEYGLTEINVDGLQDMQKAVDGTLECWDYLRRLYENGIVLYCNDEGKINNLTPSVIVVNSEGETVEMIYGNVLLVGYDFEEDHSVSLTDEQIKIIGEVFQEAIISIEKDIIKLFAAEIE